MTKVKDLAGSRLQTSKRDVADGDRDLLDYLAVHVRSPNYQPGGDGRLGSARSGPWSNYEQHCLVWAKLS